MADSVKSHWKKDGSEMDQKDPGLLRALSRGQGVRACMP